VSRSTYRVEERNGSVHGAQQDVANCIGKDNEGTPGDEGPDQPELRVGTMQCRSDE
jgi:hypothetical protein